jgi:hypothetical protein
MKYNRNVTAVRNLSTSTLNSKFYEAKTLRKCDAFFRTAIPKLRSVESRRFNNSFKGLKGQISRVQNSVINSNKNKSIKISNMLAISIPARSLSKGRHKCLSIFDYVGIYFILLNIKRFANLRGGLIYIAFHLRKWNIDITQKVRRFTLLFT